MFDGEPPYSSEDWIAFMDARPEFKKDHEFDYEVMQLMANHTNEVDLNKVCGEERATNKDNYNRTLQGEAPKNGTDAVQARASHYERNERL